MPLGPIHLAVEVWLIARGFAEASPTAGAEQPVDGLDAA